MSHVPKILAHYLPGIVLSLVLASLAKHLAGPMAGVIVAFLVGFLYPVYRVEDKK